MITNNTKLSDEEQKHNDYLTRKHKVDVDLIYEDIDQEEENQ